MSTVPFNRMQLIKTGWFGSHTHGEFIQRYCPSIPEDKRSDAERHLRRWLRGEPVTAALSDAFEGGLKAWSADIKSSPASLDMTGPLRASISTPMTFTPPPPSSPSHASAESTSSSSTSTSNAEVSALKEQMAVLQAENEELKHRYFLALGLSWKLQFMKTGSLMTLDLEELWNNAVQNGAKFEDYYTLFLEKC
ncbi:hypothetical protein Pelo_10601 [Pelomyxa schiedti]|nr:hypothetical protein Pelo_10601 [Pelomyxa schiedti]